MTKRIIVVAGNIGVGKTSLTERIGARLGWRTDYESVSDNPYLSDFYKNMHDWSFHLQVYFLGHRAQQYLDAANDPRSAILDRSIFEDFHIFTRALNSMGNIAERDYLTYRRIYDLVVGTLPPPNLLIYLQAPVQVLMDRIQKRARNIETGISESYLYSLESYYEEWLRAFDLCPVLTIHTDNLDYVHQPRALKLVLDRIQDKLAGKEIMEL